jgi:cell division protein ZapA
MCDDGQEKRIIDLAAYIDTKIKDISESGAANNDNHLLILTSLILTDEIFELRQHLETADQLMSEASSGQGLSSTDEAAVAQAINALASRIKVASERIRKV